MSENLLIVESPAKCKSLEKYLGNTFTVLASYGHVRDLMPKTGAVDVNNDYTPVFELLEKNIKHLNVIKQATKKAKALYLATDPDREGEIISWHIKEILSKEGLLKNKAVHRIVFNEISKKAVLDSLKQPRDISPNLVNAQQTRRTLDYLFGFNLSPLLWKKIRYGLSAGRVQSPALRMIVSRENEIEAFVKRPYWKVFATLESSDKSTVKAMLVSIKDKKVDQFYFKDQAATDKIISAVTKQAKGRPVLSQ